MTATDSQGQKHDYPADAVVFAVGITGEAAATTLLLLRGGLLWRICNNLLQQWGASWGCTALVPVWKHPQCQWPAAITSRRSSSTVQPCQQL